MAETDNKSVHQTFIDAGFQTFPLGVEGKEPLIKRDEKTGDKIYKNVFPTEGYGDDLKELVASNKLNTKTSKVAFLLTGKKASRNDVAVIVLDLDCAKSYKIFKELDPDNPFEFKSLGKKDEKGNDTEAGSLVYLIPKELENVYSFKTSECKDLDIKLDFFNKTKSTGFSCVFLPTENNKSKVSWKGRETPALRYPPKEVIKLIKEYYKKHPISKQKSDMFSKVTDDSNRDTKHPLGDLIEDCLRNGGDYEGNEKLFEYVAVARQRELDEFKNGDFHPNSLMKEGNGYLDFRDITFKLAKDKSVSPENFKNFLAKYNEMLGKEFKGKEFKRFVKDVDGFLDDVLDGKEGKFEYNKNWREGHYLKREKGLTFSVEEKVQVGEVHNSVKRAEILNKLGLADKQLHKKEIVLDGLSGKHWHEIDYTERYVGKPLSLTEMVNYLDTVTKGLSAKVIKSSARKLVFENLPEEPFGLTNRVVNNIPVFNTHQHTFFLDVYREPESYFSSRIKKKYWLEFGDYLPEKPKTEDLLTETFLEYITRSEGEPLDKDGKPLVNLVYKFMYPFFQEKFTTFKRSEIIFHLVGTQGSGKSTLAGLIEFWVGADNVGSPDKENFTGSFNPYAAKMFVLLDEYAEQGGSKKNIMALIKKLTGNQKVDVNDKNEKVSRKNNRATLIATENEMGFIYKGDKRRFFYLKLTEELEDQDFIKRYIKEGDDEGFSGFFEDLEKEAIHIAYKLGTEKFTFAEGSHYNCAYTTEAKKEEILNNLELEEKIYKAVKGNNFNYFEDLFAILGHNNWFHIMHSNNKTAEKQVRILVEDVVSLCNKISGKDIKNKFTDKYLKAEKLPFARYKPNIEPVRGADTKNRTYFIIPYEKVKPNFYSLETRNLDKEKYKLYLDNNTEEDSPEKDILTKRVNNFGLEMEKDLIPPKKETN